MNRAVDSASRVLEVEEPPGIADAASCARAAGAVESGNILLVRQPTFRLTARERELVADASVTLPTRKQRESRNGRPTVMFDPDSGRLSRCRIPRPQRDEIEAMMARFGEWTEHVVSKLLPAYTPVLVRDRVTFRPCERAKPQGLHVDASYGRPTEGRAMLRVFCNINPFDRARTWQVGEAFEPFARRFLPSIKPKSPSHLASWLARLGVTKGRRTVYDLMMEDLRARAKSDEAYQKSAVRTLVEFPAGSAWIVITDLVLHGALSGQYSLDQTFFLPPAGMSDAECSSLKILERLAGRALI